MVTAASKNGAAVTGLDLLAAWHTVPSKRPLPAAPATVGRIFLVAVVGSVGIAAQAGRETSIAAAVVVFSAALALSAILRAGRRHPVVTAALLVPVLGAALVLMVPVTGGRQLVLMAGAVVGAFGVFCGWDSLSWWRRAADRPVVLAGGLIVAVQVTWFRLAPQVVPAALVMAAGVVVLIAAIRPHGYDRVERGVTAVIARIAGLLAAGLVLLAALPLLYLPGAIARTADHLRPSKRTLIGTWTPYQVTVNRERKDALRPFVSTPALQWRRSTARSAAASLLLVGVAGTFLFVTKRTPDTAPSLSASPEKVAREVERGQPSLLALEFETAYSRLPAYQGVPWADELQNVQRSGDNVRNDLFNVVDGLRATPAPDCSGCPRATLWLTGGSAAFGIGQRDDHTIAAELVRLAAEDGIALTVVNLGRPGALGIEEGVALEKRLERWDAPGLIVAYTGWNDVILAVNMDFAAVQGVSELDPEGFDFLEHLQYVNDHPQEFLDSKIGPAAGLKAARRHEGIRDRMRDVAIQNGAEIYFFQQPDALVSATQLEGYEDISGIADDDLLKSPLAQAVSVFESEAAPETVSLRGLFVAAEDPTFVGLVHQNEVGARLSAEAIYEDIAGELLERASQ